MSEERSTRTSRLTKCVRQQKYESRAGTWADQRSTRNHVMQAEWQKCESAPYNAMLNRLSHPNCTRKAGDTLSSRHVRSCDVNACSWDGRGDLTLNSMVQIHTSVTLLTSRNLAWSSGRLTCQNASQISAVAHVSWDVTYVSSALQTLFPEMEKMLIEKVRQRTFLWHQVTKL